MVRFLKSGTVNDADVKQTLLMNYEKENDFLTASTVFFYVNPDIKSPMGSDAAAFATKEAAEKFKGSREGTILNWTEVFKSIQ
jgi:copper chaperone NosL